jgi:hypothetical protein
MVIGSSNLLQDNIFGPGNGPNANLIMNSIDYMNDRESIAIMRSKTLGLNPLKDTTPGLRNFIKTFNIVGLAVIVAIIGLLVWVFYNNRRKKIQEMFLGEGVKNGDKN